MTTERSWFPPGGRCIFTEPDGTTAVVEPDAAAAFAYGIHPGEWWWLIPGAWLGWSLAFTTLALVIWVLAS